MKSNLCLNLSPGSPKLTGPLRTYSDLLSAHFSSELGSDKHQKKKNKFIYIYNWILLLGRRGVHHGLDARSSESLTFVHSAIFNAHHTHTQTTGTRSCLVIFNHPIRNAIVNRWNPLAFKRRGDLLLFSFFNAYIDWSPRFLVSLQSLMNGEYIGVGGWCL